MSDKPRTLVIRTQSEAETLAVGQAFGRALTEGATLSLEGPLGAGKTVFVRGFCAGVGVEAQVTSPTYALHHEYETEAGRRVIHVDCFRLRGAAEFDDLALEDRRRSDTILLAEWGDRVIEALPSDTIRVRMEPDENAPEEVRRLTVALPDGVDLTIFQTPGEDL